MLLRLVLQRCSNVWHFSCVATLLFSRHPGIESVAILLLVGLPLCLLASVTVLPAFAVLLRVQRV